MRCDLCLRERITLFWLYSIKSFDLLIVLLQAYFLTPFSQLGLCPEGASSYLFPRILGKSKANEMLLFNYKLSAQEALQYNFISEIFKLDEIEKIWQRLEEYAQLPKESMVLCKKLIKRFEQDNINVANINENEALSTRYMSEEAIQAVMNFLNRRSKL